MIVGLPVLMYSNSASWISPRRDKSEVSLLRYWLSAPVLSSKIMRGQNSIWIYHQLAGCRGTMTWFPGSVFIQGCAPDCNYSYNLALLPWHTIVGKDCMLTCSGSLNNRERWVQISPDKRLLVFLPFWSGRSQTNMLMCCISSPLDGKVTLARNEHKCPNSTSTLA